MNAIPAEYEEMAFTRDRRRSCFRHGIEIFCGNVAFWLVFSVLGRLSFKEDCSDDSLKDDAPSACGSKPEHSANGAADFRRVAADANGCER
jgi:hypothetical protein